MKIKILGALVVVTAGIAACAGTPAPARLSAGEAEGLVHNFYGQIAAYDYAGMHASSTPEFEMIENNGTKAMRMNWDAFDKRLAGAQKAGAVLKFEPSEFNTTVTAEAVYTTYIETATNGAQYYAGITLRLVGDKWLVDRLFTMPKPKDEPVSDAAAPAAPQPDN